MKYCLVGVDGNAYSLMGYTANALKREGLNELVNEMFKKATASDYSHLIAVCCEYLDKANEKAIENGWCDDTED